MKNIKLKFYKENYVQAIQFLKKIGNGIITVIIGICALLFIVVCLPISLCFILEEYFKYRNWINNIVISLLVVIIQVAYIVFLVLGLYKLLIL
jgi:hypothetical protein